MTCIHIHVHPVSRGAASAPEPEPAKWLHLGSPPGPRSPRTRWRSTDQSGPVISTETSWINVGGLDMETRQALHEAHLFALKRELTKTLRLLRADNRHSGALICEAQLRAVTHELLAMGDR